MKEITQPLLTPTGCTKCINGVIKYSDCCHASVEHYAHNGHFSSYRGKYCTSCFKDCHAITNKCTCTDEKNTTHKPNIARA